MKLYRNEVCAAIVLVLALCAPSALRADVTLRYQTEFKPAAALQPFMEPLLKTMQSGPAGSISIKMKGTQGYTTSGNWGEIFDFVKGDVTLVDPAHKTFATFPLSELMDKMMSAMPQMPEQPEAFKQIMASMKTHLDSKETGQTAEIQGVQAEERLVHFDVEIPLPPGMAPQMGPSIDIKLVIHIWTAKKEEAMRVPVVRELTGYQTWQKYVINPAGIFEKLTASMPGVGEAIGPLFKEMAKNPGVLLRTRMEVYMPFLATVAKQAAAQGQSFPAIDPDAPLLEMSQEAAELSNAPVDASLFEIPKGYTPVAAEDMVREMVKAQQATAAAAAAPPK
jgi:hypothetical protein